MFNFLPPSLYTDGSFTALGIAAIAVVLSVVVLVVFAAARALSNKDDGIMEIGYQPYPQGNHLGNSSTPAPAPYQEPDELETEEDESDDIFKESTLLDGLVAIRAWFRSSASDSVIIKNNAPYAITIRFSGAGYDLGDITISPTDEITIPIDNLDCVDIFVAKAEDDGQTDSARFLHDGEDLGIEAKKTSTEEFTLLEGELKVTVHWNRTWKDRLVLENLGDFDIDINFNNQDDAPEEITITPADKVTLSVHDLDCLDMDVAPTGSDEWEDNLELFRPE